MNRANKRGSSTLPWGTPAETGYQEHITFVINDGLVAISKIAVQPFYSWNWQILPTKLPSCAARSRKLLRNRIELTELLYDPPMHFECYRVHPGGQPESCTCVPSGSMLGGEWTACWTLSRREVDRRQVALEFWPFQRVGQWVWCQMVLKSARMWIFFHSFFHDVWNCAD